MILREYYEIGETVQQYVSYRQFCGLSQFVNSHLSFVTVCEGS
jgi:hypothetical protein